MSSQLAQLPANELVIQAGRLQALCEYTLWNNEPVCTVQIERRADGSFYSSIGDPEHGGVSSFGTIEEVTDRLHRAFSAPIIAAFSLATVDEKTLETMGFKGYKVTSQQ